MVGVAAKEARLGGAVAQAKSERVFKKRRRFVEIERVKHHMAEPVGTIRRNIALSLPVAAAEDDELAPLWIKERKSVAAAGRGELACRAPDRAARFPHPLHKPVHGPKRNVLVCCLIAVRKRLGEGAMPRGVEWCPAR